MRTGEQKTMYKVTFTGYDGSKYRLDTLDAAKIGPWLAEMFGEFPYRASSPTSVDVQTSSWIVT